MCSNCCASPWRRGPCGSAAAGCVAASPAAPPGGGHEPCACGWYGDPERACRCGERQRRRYWARLSGPLLDRIDLQVVLRRPSAAALARRYGGNQALGGAEAAAGRGARMKPVRWWRPGSPRHGSGCGSAIPTAGPMPWCRHRPCGSCSIPRRRPGALAGGSPEPGSQCPLRRTGAAGGAHDRRSGRGSARGQRRGGRSPGVPLLRWPCGWGGAVRATPGRLREGAAATSSAAAAGAVAVGLDAHGWGRCRLSSRGLPRACPPCH